MTDLLYEFPRENRSRLIPYISEMRSLNLRKLKKYHNFEEIFYHIIEQTSPNYPYTFQCPHPSDEAIIEAEPPAEPVDIRAEPQLSGDDDDDDVLSISDDETGLDLTDIEVNDAPGPGGGGGMIVAYLGYTKPAVFTSLT